MIGIHPEEKQRLLPAGSSVGSSQYLFPPRTRLQSLTIVNPRVRSNSVTIFNDDGEDVTGTSHGPVVLETLQGRTDWLLGWFLAIISGILFTANNFFVKYLTVDAIEMLLIRSLLQTLL